MSYFCDICGKNFGYRKKFIDHACFQKMLAGHRKKAKPEFKGEYAGVLNDLLDQTKVVKRHTPKHTKYSKVREISGRQPGVKKKNRLPTLAKGVSPSNPLKAF